MALRISTGARNFVNQKGAIRQAFNGGIGVVRTGSQPLSANDAETGDLLFYITDDGGDHTPEVRASGGTTLVGTAGSVDSLTVNGIEIMGSATPFNTSLAQTAEDVVFKINTNPQNLLFLASSSGAVITISAKVGLGALPNTWVVAPGGSGGITFTGTADLSGGVTPVNGLLWDISSSGIMVMNRDQIWKGIGLRDDNAGWVRFRGSVSDPGTADTAGLYVRMDGACASSGAQLNGPTSVQLGAPQIITANMLTLAAA